MKEEQSHSYNELKAGVTESELIRTGEQMINNYLMGDIPRSELASLVDEFERMVREEHPNPERNGCPRSQLLRERTAAKIDHIKKCWPCLEIYSGCLR